MPGLCAHSLLSFQTEELVKAASKQTSSLPELSRQEDEEDMMRGHSNDITPPVRISDQNDDDENNDTVAEKAKAITVADESKDDSGTGRRGGMARGTRGNEDREDREVIHVSSMDPTRERAEYEESGALPEPPEPNGSPGT